MAKPSASIKDIDFMFVNTPVRVIVSRNCPEIELAGLRVGPFEEGKEYEVKFWVARELERAGIARFREEELLDAVKLYKLHWKERVQSVQQISSLSEDFYPRLRRYLAGLKREAVNNPEKMKEYEKVTRLSHDIINCRLRKIISLASAPAQTDQILKNLTKEERIIYERLYTTINEWRSTIVRWGEES
ncbi:MAG: GINS complex protein [Candidatus Bathyarchaeota archaeon BA1]|nr:MAG: GINS complex protein [Candidatus Bathyarchaeota archaeon BA1]